MTQACTDGIGPVVLEKPLRVVWIFHYFMTLSAIERCISPRIIKQSKSFSIHLVCFKLPQYKNSWIALNFIKAHFTLNRSTSGHLSKEGHSIKLLYQGFSGMHILGIYLHSIVY